MYIVAAMHLPALFPSYSERCIMYYPCRLPAALRHFLNSGAVTANTHTVTVNYFFFFFFLMCVPISASYYTTHLHY